MPDTTKHVCGKIRAGNLKHKTTKSGPVVMPNSIPTCTDNCIWGGYVASSPTGPFTEADAVFYVPHTTSAGDIAPWVGLGGVYGNLLQGGVEVEQDPDTGQITYFAWFENIAVNPCDYNSQHAGGNNAYCLLDPQYYPIQAGDRMQVQVTKTTVYIGSSRGWRSTFTYAGYGINSVPDNQTAEWVVEDASGMTAHFGSVTFYGVGDTQTNGVYSGLLDGYCGSSHGQCVTGVYLTTSRGGRIGSLSGISYNTTWGPPNDAFSYSY